MKSGFKGCGYTFLFNILDYSAGVLPVTHVDKELDALDTKAFKPRNAIERDMYQMYDSKKMHGLPVGVQVVGELVTVKDKKTGLPGPVTGSSPD
ncbi:hypothetical protein ONZ51_g12686 [Trametes cubensis]|uniref:Uncharacterized protein n=1 Tax=Trametes cubensis TaxID=1111947 RepID=A0AAD7TFR1_9APHY|nr:hypothetical protein ONZ51_g12686 [Trametes cubensis]